MCGITRKISYVEREVAGKTLIRLDILLCDDSSLHMKFRSSEDSIHEK